MGSNSPRLGGPGELVKARIALNAADWHGFASEGIWVLRGGNQGVLRSVPFYARGLAWGDEVRLLQEDALLSVGDVVSRSGHSCYRVFREKGCSVKSFRNVLQPLLDLGVTYEGISEHHLALDVPPGLVHKAYRLLELGERAAAWDFEEGFAFLEG